MYYFRTANKGSQLLDLEKYFKQQAALAEQKRKLKKATPSKTPDKNHSVSVKKAKLLNTDARTNKKCQKSKYEDNNDNKDNSLYIDKIILDKADFNVGNEIADNSSESEYIPSDNELDSGNINIRYV